MSLYSREDVSHMNQLHGLEAIQHSDEPVLDQKQPPKWKKKPEKIETPSNSRLSLNPFSHRNYNNLRETRASVSSSQSPFQSTPSGSRSNPNSKTVVTSHYFPPSTSSSTVNTHVTSRNGTGMIRHDTRPAKKRKTDLGSVVTSQTFIDDTNFGNSDSWKTQTTHISPMTSSKLSPPVIDVDDESAGENNTPPPLSISIFSSPLTPTESSDDIALRPNKPHTSYSPSATEGIRNSLRSNPSKDRMTSRNLSTATDHNSFENPKTAFPDVPYTQALAKRYQSDPIQDPDEFDKLTLGDDSRKDWRSKASRRSEIPKGLVKSSIEHIEGLSSRRDDNPPFVDLLKVRSAKGLVNGMKAKKSEGLRESTVADVPKPPPKANSAISTTNFMTCESSKFKNNCAPLIEYFYEGQLFKTADDRPYSAHFSKDSVSIICGVDLDTPVLKLPLRGSLMCPRDHRDFESQRIFIFRFGSSPADSLGLKFHSPGNTSSTWLSSLYKSTQKLVQGANEYVSQDTLSRFWTDMLDSKRYQTDESINDSSISKGSSTIKPKPQAIQRTTRGAAARNNSIMGSSSGVTDRVRRSLSPSSEELILVYPPSGTGALNITYGDIKRLEPGEFLNDTLIEFGLKSWLSDFRDRDSELADQVHVFSSFFYTQLRQKNLEEGYQSVRKWTSRVDIFKKNYIIVPINEHLHWYLAIICYPGRLLQHNAQPNLNNSSAVTRSKEQESAQESVQQIEIVHPATPSSDSMLTAQEEKEVEMQTRANLVSDESIDVLSGAFPPHHLPSDTGSPGPSRSLTRSPTAPGFSEPELVPDIPDTMDVDDPPEDITTKPTLSEVPHIFTFDSLGSRHANVLKTLNSYLQMEAKDKKDLAVSVNAYTGQALVPTQPNSCDCGIYLLHFVEQFMSDPERYVKQILNKPPKKSWSIVKSEREQIWNADKVAGKREALKQKVICLSTEWKQSRKPEPKGKGKGKEQEEVQPSGTSTRSDDEDSDIQVLEITPAPSTNKPSKPSKQKAQRLR